MKKSFGFLQKTRERLDINTDGTKPGHPDHSYINDEKIFYLFLGHSWDNEEEKIDENGRKQKIQQAFQPVGFICKNWCRDQDLNQGHTDFQSVALPTELSRHLSC